VGRDTEDAAADGEQLKEQVCHLIDALVEQDAERSESDFVLMLSRVQSLVERKRRMEGSKTDTRDLLTEMLFSRLRLAMQQLLEGQEPLAQQRAAEWVMGALYSIATLTEIARAFDQVLLRSTHNEQDFNFASRTDFLSVEEVMQMLSAGKHMGCLSLEKADNRLDVYIREGRIVFLDPHHLIRRVIPAVDSLRQREIPAAALTEAEAQRAKTGRPVLLCLFDAGHLRKEELRETMRMFGREVLYDFMIASEPFVFYYRRQDAVPEFAVEHDFRLGVTSLLLEGSKRVDDWKLMQQVFPDPDAPVEPRADMFARMGDVALDVLEIKLLSQINGAMSPRGLVPVLGLPLFDVYQMLVRLAREGIIASAGSAGGNVATERLSVEESMQEAFAALDANDDARAVASALDSVLGSDEPAPRPADEPPPRRPVRSTPTSSVLDRVLGSSGSAPPAPKGKTLQPDPPADDEDPPLRTDQDFLSILKRPRRK
jgi:hypothetical protein